MVEIVVWDVQHGSACFIKTARGLHVVQDLGTGSIDGCNHDFSPLKHLYYKYRVQTLDAVIISHPHSDHLDDIQNLRLFRIGQLVRPQHLAPREVLNGNPPNRLDVVHNYLELTRLFPNAISRNSLALPTINDGDVTIEMFLPRTCSTKNLNNHSIVSVVAAGGVKVVIPGDNEQQSWWELLDESSFVEAIKGADVLIASHHGRESGFCEEIFEFFTPKLCVISDGPATSTNISSAYSEVASGWLVNRRYGSAVERYCLTTRSDGPISLKFGESPNRSSFLSVTID